MITTEQAKTGLMLIDDFSYDMDGPPPKHALRVEFGAAGPLPRGYKAWGGPWSVNILT